MKEIAWLILGAVALVGAVGLLLVGRLDLTGDIAFLWNLLT